MCGDGINDVGVFKYVYCGKIFGCLYLMNEFVVGFFSDVLVNKCIFFRIIVN